jgi:hypothetical protein
MGCCRMFPIVVLVFALSLTTSVYAQEKPETYADFFTQASVKFIAARLVGNETLGHEARDSADPNAHLPWAKSNSIETVQKDLIEKFDLMAGIMSKRGREALAGWYADICTEWSGYGVDFGGPAENDPKWEGHFRWASNPNVPLEDIKTQLRNRIVKIFASYAPTDIVVTSLQHFDVAEKQQVSELQTFSQRSTGMVLRAQQTFEVNLRNRLTDLAKAVKSGRNVPSTGSAMSIEHMDNYPNYGVNIVSPGGAVFVFGSNFGKRPGRVVIELDTPLEGRKSVELRSFTNNWSFDWEEDAIFLSVPDLPRFRDAIGARLTIHSADGGIAPISKPITLSPKLTVYQVSGAKFFLGGRGEYSSGTSTQFDMSGINQAIEADRYLFILHSPSCGRGWMRKGNDYFKHGLYLPQYMRLAKVIIYHADLTRPWLDRMQEIEGRVAREIEENGLAQLEESLGGPIIFETDFPTADWYGVRPEFAESKFGYRMLSVEWTVNCQDDSAYEGKPLTYVATFYLVGPEGYPPPTVPTDKTMPF